MMEHTPVYVLAKEGSLGRLLAILDETSSPGSAQATAESCTVQVSESNKLTPDSASIKVADTHFASSKPP